MLYHSWYKWLDFAAISLKVTYAKVKVLKLNVGLYKSSKEMQQAQTYVALQDYQARQKKKETGEYSILSFRPLDVTLDCWSLDFCFGPYASSLKVRFP